MSSSLFQPFRPRRPWIAICIFAILAVSALFAQYQKAPPDFGGSYAFPSPTHPEPRAAWVRVLDVVLLAAGLGLGSWLILKRRSRNGVLVMTIGAVAYFGFYRKGCVCPIGAIQIACPDHAIVRVPTPGLAPTAGEG